MGGVLDIATEPHAKMQRIKGTARLTFAHLDGRTRLGRLYQDGAAKIRLPRTHNGPALDAVLINTSGGMTGGDDMRWSIDAGKGASAIITTQACEKIYRASSGTASVAVNIRLNKNAALSWLPQETILFDQSALSRQMHVDLAPEAGLLLAEPLILGRQAMGEAVSGTCFRDRWRIYRGGRLLHAEDLRLEGDIQKILSRRTTTNSATAFATVLFIHRDAADLIDPLRGMLGPNAAASAVQSAAGSRLVMRMVAENGFELRRQLAPVIDYCNRKLTGADQGLPKLWNT